MPIANPWGSLPRREPYVLPMDCGVVDEYRQRKSVQGNPDYEIHDELLPTPYLGDPLAPVVLLSRNPGFSDRDEDDYAGSAFHRTADRSLTHVIDDWPFFPINPQFQHTASYEWWVSKLKSLIDDTDKKTVAKGVFCVQAFPYHSFRGFPGATPSVPSQEYTNDLLLQALNRGALVVGLLARRHWENVVPQLRTHDPICWSRSPLAGTVSPGNLDCFDDIVSVLKRWKR